LYPLGWTFFGLTLKTAPLVRKNLFKQIHDIVFHGKGGFDYPTVYNMPIWLRKFTFKEIQDYFDAETEANKKATKKGGTKSMVNPDGKINVPDFKSASAPYKGKTSYK